jgi:hypothetical protein
MSKQPDEQLDTLDMSVTSRLKRVRMAYRKSQKENQRLRELLAEIEWSSYAMYATTVQYGVCPSCKAPKEDGHFEGCRLAKELSDG